MVWLTSIPDIILCVCTCMGPVCVGQWGMCGDPLYVTLYVTWALCVGGWEAHPACLSRDFSIDNALCGPALDNGGCDKPRAVTGHWTTKCNTMALNHCMVWCDSNKHWYVSFS